jgi:hypothetical protein
MRLIRFYIKLGQVPNYSKPPISNSSSLPALPEGYKWVLVDPEKGYYGVVDSKTGQLVRGLPLVQVPPEVTKPPLHATKPFAPLPRPYSESPVPQQTSTQFKPSPSGIYPRYPVTGGTPASTDTLSRPPFMPGRLPSPGPVPPQNLSPVSPVTSRPSTSIPAFSIDVNRFNKVGVEPRPTENYIHGPVEKLQGLGGPKDAEESLEEEIINIVRSYTDPNLGFELLPRQKDPKTGAIRIGEFLWRPFDPFAPDEYRSVPIGMFTVWTMPTEKERGKFGLVRFRWFDRDGPYGIDLYRFYVIEPLSRHIRMSGLNMPELRTRDWADNELMDNTLIVMDRKAMVEINQSVFTAYTLWISGGEFVMVQHDPAAGPGRNANVTVTYGKSNYIWDHSRKIVEDVDEFGFKVPREIVGDPGWGLVFIARIPSGMLAFSMVPAVALQILNSGGKMAPEDINPFLTVPLHLEDNSTIYIAAPLHRNYNTDLGYREELLKTIQNRGLLNKYNEVNDYYKAVTVALVSKYLHYREQVFKLHYEDKVLPHYYEHIGPSEENFHLLEQALVNMANEYRNAPGADKEPDWKKVKLAVPMFIPGPDGPNRFFPVVVSAEEFFKNMENDIKKDPGLAWFYLSVLARNAYMYGYVPGIPQNDPFAAAQARNIR